MIRQTAALWCAALCLLAGGCASLTGGATDPSDPQAAAAATGPAVVEVQIDAPDDLKKLLETHLDLVRLSRLSKGETVDASELGRLIDSAPAQVQELVQTEGYFAAQVAIVRAGPASPGAPERVQLKVKPGPRARVSRVTLEADGPLGQAVAAGDAAARATLDELRTGWRLPAGSAFRNPDWAQAKVAALARLRAAGYAAANWSGTAAEVDVPQHSVRLFLVADSGPLFRTGDIDVEGIEAQDLETVLNLANFGRGTPATERLLLDYQERLIRSGLFQRVTVMLEADATRAGAARVLVRVTEQPLNQVTVGIGVSAKTGPRVTYEHTWRRVFGRPATARNKFEWGRDRQAWDGDISTRPGPDLYRWFTGGTLERLLSPSDEVLSAYLRFGRVQDLLTDEVSYYGQYDSSSTRSDGSRNDAIALSAHYQWLWRRIDNPLLPTRGFTLSAQVGGGYARETSGDNAGDRGAFTRVYGRLIGYLPFGERWYMTSRVEAGKVFAPGELAIPDGLRFRAGGDDSVRGYAYRSLGPVSNGEVGSGNVLLTGSIEVARPFVDSMPQFLGAVFVDAGNAADTYKDFKAVYGSGFGVRWRSPVGPLKLDLAYGHEDEKFRLHFSVGIVF